MKKLIFTIGIGLLSISAWAQPDPPNNPVPLPGIIILVAAGAALGVRQLKKNQKL